MDRRWFLTPALALGVVAAAAIAPTLTAWAPPGPEPEPVVARDVDIVLCLDTSGSMTDLLESTKAKLWDIVDEVGEQDETANLRVALVTFGDDTRSDSSQSFISVRSDLTGDLDTLYGEVMQLHTNGSVEFVGMTIGTALDTLTWSQQDGAVQMIFVAGNESAHQGPVPLAVATQRALVRGITVNSLFAGDRADGHRDGWSTLAQLGGGEYIAIDMERGTEQRDAPQDRRLDQLNARLNDTYLPYGAKGAAGKANQQAQDGNARKLGNGSSSSRTSAKSKGIYKNPEWDLVDAVTNGSVDIEALPMTALPDDMKTLPKAERKDYVAKKEAEREAIRKEIDTVSTERDAFLDATAEASDKEGLDEAIQTVVTKKVPAKKKKKTAPTSR